MFRQFDRPFLVGAVSGGAGGEGTEGAPTAPELTFTERTLDFELVPVEHWDTPGSPAGHGVEGGQIHFYRPGDVSPSFAAPVGGPVALPVGSWYLVGEAPGWVTTHEASLQVRRGEQGDGGLVIPVMAACEVRLEEGAAWDAVERLDLVSLTESAVYPVVPKERRSLWVPAGGVLAYSVSGDRITGIGRERACEPGHRLAIAPPPAPEAGRQALIVEMAKPGTRGTEQGEIDLLTEDGGQEGTVIAPDALVWMGDRGFAFFTDLPAVPVLVRFAGGESEPGSQRVGAAEKTVREVPVPIR